MGKQNFYKMAATAALAGAMMAGLAMPAFATGWQEDERGRWYGTNEDNTTWHRRNWYWIDDNGDNIAERYYFDEDGYLVTNGTEVGWGDELTNENGAWIKDGIVQTRMADLRALPLPQADGANDAIGWRQDGAGWRYIPGRDSTAWYRDGWYWIDDNNDNIAECYYFDKNGYRLTSTSAPDNYYVNENGAWNDLTYANGEEGYGLQQRIVDPAKASNVIYDVHDYDSQGLSKAAMDILGHTRVENKKYGGDDGNSYQVTYSNGLRVDYGYPDKKDGRPYNVYADGDFTKLFREPISGTKEDAERLKAKGYDASWGWGGLAIEGFWDKRVYISMGSLVKVRDDAWENWGTDWGY